MEPKQRNRAPSTRRYGRAPAGGRDMEIAGEVGRPGARQFTNAVEANANRTLVGDTEGLPGYGLRRGRRG